MSVSESTSTLENTSNNARAAASASRHRYGPSSWAFFAVTTSISFFFMVFHVLFTGVRSGAISEQFLEELFFPNVYWWITTGNMVTMVFSGVAVGLTIALIVVRGMLHRYPCGLYSMFLVLQLIPWFYFISVLP